MKNQRGKGGRIISAAHRARGPRRADSGHDRPHRDPQRPADSHHLLLRSPQASALIGAVTLVLGLGLTAILSGGNDLSARLYLAAAETELFAVGYVVSEVILLGLVAAWGATAITLWLRRRTLPLAALVIGGAGAVVAYGASELLKLVFTSTRPCTTFEAVAVATCPPSENWSYPSNHTVIACALAVSLVAAVPRLGFFAVPAALLTGVARVFAGHHYPHDVLGGILLGTTVCAAVVLLTAPIVLHSLQRRSSR